MEYGLIENQKVFTKREMDFSSEDKTHIEEVIEKSAVEYIEEILNKNNLTIEGIEKIGIAAPGTIKDGIIVKAENLGIYNFNIICKKRGTQNERKF